MGKYQIGRLPISYPWFWLSFNTAAIKAGIGPLGTHTLRHTYRSWLDSVGTPLAVQQKLMRHSDIRTTMSYGDIVDGRMKEAHSKVASLVFRNAGLKEEVGKKSGCHVHLAVFIWLDDPRYAKLGCGHVFPHFDRANLCFLEIVGCQIDLRINSGAGKGLNLKLLVYARPAFGQGLAKVGCPAFGRPQKSQHCCWLEERISLNVTSSFRLSS